MGDLDSPGPASEETDLEENSGYNYGPLRKQSATEKSEFGTFDYVNWCSAPTQVQTTRSRNWVLYTVAGFLAEEVADRIIDSDERCLSHKCKILDEENIISMEMESTVLRKRKERINADNSAYIVLLLYSVGNRTSRQCQQEPGFEDKATVRNLIVNEESSSLFPAGLLTVVDHYRQDYPENRKIRPP